VSEHYAQPHPAASSSNHDKLVLTYDNTAMTDGVGAQLQRIYGIYAISRLLGVSYLHSPLSRVDYQGLSALEANSADPDFHHDFNDLFQLRSDILPTGEFHTLNLHDISLELFHVLIDQVDRGATGGIPSLVRLMMPYGIADRFPDCYEVCKEISPFASAAREGRALRVAVHVRRGEQVVLNSARLLPNVYYINVARNVANVLDELRLEYEIELWTEVPIQDFIVEPDHHGISNRISATMVAGPEMFRLDDFKVLPNLVHCINGRAIDCLRKLATADILVMSRSSFSYVGGILNRNGIVLYHPFWHRALSSWITVGQDGQFNEVQLRKAVNDVTL
jgi:hypothetical protein